MEVARFIIISGLPGSGKTTLARNLAPALSLPVIDKDQILERLFESKGVGDATWRRALSRESDLILEHALKLGPLPADTGNLLAKDPLAAGLSEGPHL